MNIDAYNLIIDTIKPLLDNRGFQTVDTETGSYFTDEHVAVRVTFDEGKSLFCLEQAAVADGEVSDQWKVLSSWLFEKTAKPQEAKSIANDFEDSLRELLGIKPTVQKLSGFQMPEKGTPGSVPGIMTLTNRFLTIFPQFKGEYEQCVTEDGSFLFTEFYETVAANHLKELLRNNDKKRLNKYFDVLNDIYCQGDSEVRAVISTCVLATALHEDKELFALALEYMKEMPYLSTATRYSIALKKN